MKTLWAPWRIEYLEPEKKSHRKKNNLCLFCEAVKKKPSEKNLVLYHGKTAFIMMNLFPYSNGHMMIIPKRHISDLALLKTSEHAELGELLALCSKILKQSLKCEGFNVGLNLGKAAGAGIAGHLHYHMVPRWVGDHNFMATLSSVRVIPEHIKKTYQRLKSYFG